MLSSSKNPYGSKTSMATVRKCHKLSSSKNPYGSKTKYASSVGNPVVIF